MRELLYRFLHSRSCVALFAVLMAVAAIVAWGEGITDDNTTTNLGSLFLSPDEWFGDGLTSLAVNVVVNIVAALLLVTLNKTYNITRSLSALSATLFLVMQIGSPALITDFGSGTMLVVVLIASTFLLFSVYQSPGNTRRIFLMFFIVSLSTLSLYPLAFYIPVLLIGMLQMKVFTARGVSAALLGLITPLWILLGFGLVTLSDFEMPGIVSVFNLYDVPTLLTVFVTALLTALISVAFIMMNAIKMLTYNSRIRAANGFLTLLLIFSMLFAAIDFNNIAVYLPVVNWLAAYQAGHYFATSSSKGNYPGILAVVAAYVLLYAWNLSL